MGALTITIPNPALRPEHEVASEVLKAVRADAHPGAMVTNAYSHLLACLTHVGEQYGVVTE